MTANPRVVFGMPAYNRPDALPRTLESLLSQTYRDFAIVIVDDRPSPQVRAVVDAYSALHPRISYEPNSIRLGMIANWRKAFELSRQLYPHSEYFAWASDHDMWHPRWLEVLVAVLDDDPRVVLAYPQIMRVYTNGRRRITRLFDTAGLTRPEDRLRRVVTGMTAGNGVYGLFRAAPLARAGVFRAVLLPDRQILERLSLVGQFKHVPEILWYREVAGMFSLKRQRRMFFPGVVPLHTYFPVNLQHFGLLLWDLGIRGCGRPEFGRLAGIGYAGRQLAYSTKRALLRKDTWWRVALGRRAFRWLSGRTVPTRHSVAN